VKDYHSRVSWIFRRASPRSPSTLAPRSNLAHFLFLLRFNLGSFTPHEPLSSPRKPYHIIAYTILSTMRSSNISSDHIPLNEVLPSESLYPSRLEIEAIEIPDCQEVFRRIATPTRRRESCSGHSSSQPKPTQSPTSTSYRSKAFAGNESGGSYRSQSERSMVNVNVPGPSRISRLELEVAPGVFLSLHGSQETLSAMQEGQLVSATCFECVQTVMCVPQALYVLCPDCRVVSPVVNMSFPSLKQSPTLLSEMGGVGLGMKCLALG
jgi:hypothetical protein